MICLSCTTSLVENSHVEEIQNSQRSFAKFHLYISYPSTDLVSFNKKGAEEMAAMRISCSPRSLKTEINFSSCRAGPMLTIPGKITQEYSSIQICLMFCGLTVGASHPQRPPSNDLKRHNQSYYQRQS